MDELTERLDQADPATGLRRDEAAALIMAMVDELPADRMQRPRWWQNLRIMVPLGAVGALALTGAAIAVPLVIAVNGEHVDLDARVPIVYETETGVSVTCEYGVYVMSGDARTAEDERAAEILASEDWTGVGQDVYDSAIANPHVPQEGEIWANDSPELRDGVAFKLALTRVITSRLPPDLQGVGMGSTDTCTGPFR
ncbi:hypothetical protein ABC304_07780 [Microbacterium sp. 1P10UB]|uniref:hypothetical protein n=1 Tax=unclassified Microbacterium TaxID=2609290 RepID=UPI0039A30E14